MFSSNLVLASAALAAAGLALAQSTLTVNTATSGLTQCQPYSITWTGGTAPFFPVITAAMDVNTVLKSFPQTNDQSVLWIVDQPVGTTVTFAVRDASGVQHPSGVSSPIIAGTSDSCLNGGGSSSGAATPPATGPSTPGTQPATTAPSTTAPSTSSSSSSSSSVSKTTTPSTPTPTTKQPDGAASIRGSSAVVAAVVGIAVAALL